MSTSISGMDQRLQQLSPEKRALLLKRLREQAAEKAAEQEITITSVDRTQPIPLSFAQQRLWFLSQFDGANAAYNIANAVRIDGPIRLDLLEQAIQIVIERHEVLRTTFQVKGGNPVQVIAPSLTLPMTIYDLRQTDDQQYSHLITESTQATFDLAKGPLMRVEAIRLKNDGTIVMVTMHHIISDGWSLGILIKEIFSLYHSLSNNLSFSLEPLKVQYADFSNWQRQWLQGDVLDHQLNYWQGKLGGAPVLLDLPSDRPRPPVHRFRGKSLTFEIPDALTTQLTDLAKATNTTLFMVLESALAVLLFRLSGQDDIVVGSPIANRTHKSLEPLIGFFVNTLLLRNDCSGNPTFKALLEQVKNTALDAYQHQDVPFEQLVDSLKTERTLSYTPLFQVMFALQNMPMESLELGDLTITPLSLENPTAKFDLTIFMVEDNGLLRGVWEYNEDLFDPETAERMVGQFKTVLDAIATAPHQHLLDIPLLSPEEHHKIVVEWNQTETPYPTDTCLHELFEAQVERTPDNVAIMCRDQSLTYASLNSQANQLAYQLVDKGLKPGQLVGICVERSLDMVVALFAVLKAGGVYVPMDPTYPTDRLAHMLTDAQVVILLTQSHLVDQLPATDITTIFLDQNEDNIPLQLDINLAPTRQATDLAYVIYTSGSTGKPKGVMIDHRGAVNTLADINRRYQVNANDRVLGLSSLSFDLSVYDIFGLLAVGGAVVIPEPEATLTPQRWWELIQQQQVTIWNTAPAVMDLFANYVARQQLTIPASLRVVMMSGDAISVTLPDQIKALAENKAISVNSLGGATEGSIWSICYPIDTVEPSWTSIPYGQPLDNQTFHILDERLNPVPVGTPGELHIGGLGVALGYLNRPELNEKRFLPDPFSDRADARLYKTGDMGRYRPDGVIEFLGRIDTQVKIRGFRVELGEIEALLVQQSQVSEAVVVVWEPQPGDQRLCAYVVMPKVLAVDQAGQTAILKRTLREQLPGHMVPATFVVLDEIPLTANGKVNRKALPAPTEPVTQSDIPFIAAKTQTERTIVTVWQEVLQLEKVGTQDNFFDLGGHSLLMVQVHTELMEKLDDSLTIVELFQYSTVSTLAQYIDQKQTAVSATEQAQQRQQVRNRRQGAVAQRRQSRQQHRRNA